MNFKELDLGRKLIIISSGVAVISFFLPWVEIGIASASGFQQMGFVFFVFYLYPLLKTVKNENFSKLSGILLSLSVIISSVVYIQSKSGTFLNTGFNMSGSGAYLFLICSVTLLVGCTIRKDVETVEGEIINDSVTNPDNKQLSVKKLLPDSQQLDMVKDKAFSAMVGKEISDLVNKHKTETESFMDTLKRALLSLDETEEVRSKLNLLQKEHVKVRSYAVRLQKELKTLRQK